MKTYSVRCTFQDRRQGPGTGRTIRVNACTVPGAIGKASRDFWNSLNRKQRFDAANTMKIEIHEVRELQEASPEVYRMFEDAVKGQTN